jgi:hypothetical protein
MTIAWRRSTPTGTAFRRLPRQLPRPDLQRGKIGFEGSLDEYRTGQRAYRGRGDLTFDDVTEVSGRAIRARRRSGPSLDYDGDGRTDLYVANDQWRTRSSQRGRAFPGCLGRDRRWVPGRRATAFGRRTRSGMGLVSGDFDGDGRPDPT